MRTYCICSGSCWEVLEPGSDVRGLQWRRIKWCLVPPTISSAGAANDWIDGTMAEWSNRINSIIMIARTVMAESGLGGFKAATADKDARHSRRT